MAKKKNNAAAVIEQPKPEPTPAQKAEHKRERLVWELEDVIRGAQRMLVDFALAIAKSGPTYAMKWHGEDAMRAEQTGSEAWQLFQFIVASEKSIVEKLDVLKAMSDRLTRDLVGDGYGGSSGPWHGRSTCPISNIAALTECDAKRTMFRLYAMAITAFEAQVAVSSFPSTWLYNTNFPLAEQV
jgi:hypothetical protein